MKRKWREEHYDKQPTKEWVDGAIEDLAFKIGNKLKKRRAKA